MKRILITGENSYIGNGFEKWISRNSDEYNVDKISVRDDSWKILDFSVYDVIVHVAGIAHISTDSKMKELYYRVNRDLTGELAKKAKAEGVKQFIFISSIIVYGDSKLNSRVIDINTTPSPSNFYGDSKLQAEIAVQKLENSDFAVVIIRPPMIYGKNSKGNYPKLAKLANYTPVFPRFENSRSMLHIDNLCEFLKIIIDIKGTGIYFPQNKEYVNSTDLVLKIAKVKGRNIKTTTIFNGIIKMLFNISIVNKVFGSITYEKSLSEYDNIPYQIRTFEESIELTEARN